METSTRRAAGLGLVDGIPFLLVEPNGPAAGVAVWLPPFGSSAQDMRPFLGRLAGAGWAAVGIDPLRHGRRAPDAGSDGTGADLATRTFAAFRAEMWQILGRTTLDAMRVVDWVLQGHGALPVVAGGLSMGGDIAVALAGIDPRVRRVAAVASTPDWRRPGMRALEGGREVVDQGRPTCSSAWLERRLAPVRHPQAFDRDVDVLFVQGSEDTHVPPEASQRFRDRLAGSRARVTVDLVAGAGHEVCRDPGAQDRALRHLLGSPAG